jgi:hypothetical protein
VKVFVGSKKTNTIASCTYMKKRKGRKLTYEKIYDTHNDCNYVAYCIADGICPYDIKELMRKVRNQAIKDTVELINMENENLKVINIDDDKSK